MLFSNSFYMNQSNNDGIVSETSLNTFDLIICQGQNYWFSSLVEYFTKSPYSHVGIILRDPTDLNPELNGIYFLESGQESFPDAEDHLKKFGVQITDYDKWLSSYVGHVYVRRLKTQLDRAELLHRFHEIHQTIHNKPYDVWAPDLIRCWLDLDVGNTQQTQRFFCSALVSYVYSQLGILPSTLKWDLITPGYLASPELNIMTVRSQFGELEKLK